MRCVDDGEDAALTLLAAHMPGMAGERLAGMFQWVLGGGMAEYDSASNVARAR